jgi:hypothetical protein
LVFDIGSILVSIIVGVIFTAPVLWIAGRFLVGATRAKFTDAIIIVILGNIASAVIGAIVGGFIGAIAQIIVYLFLIKYYYECSWLKALEVAVVTVIIFAIIALILGVLGFALLAPVFRTTSLYMVLI